MARVLPPQNPGSGPLEITGRLQADWHRIPSELRLHDSVNVPLRRALTYALGTDQYRAHETILGVVRGEQPISELTRLGRAAHRWRPHTIEYEKSWNTSGEMSRGEFVHALGDLSVALRRIARARR